MKLNRFIAAAGTLALAASLAGGLAAQASASVVPGTIHGVITGLHTLRLDPGFAALPKEVIRPQLPGYSSTVTVTSVSGQTVTVNGTFLPLNTKGADVTFATVSAPIPAPMTIAITGITSSKATATTDYVAVTTTPANGIPLVIFVDGIQVASPVTVAPGSTHSFVVKLVDPGNIVVAASAPVTASAKVFAPPKPAACAADFGNTTINSDGSFSWLIQVLNEGTPVITLPAGWVLTWTFVDNEQITSATQPFAQAGANASITGTDALSGSTSVWITGTTPFRGSYGQPTSWGTGVTFTLNGVTCAN